jgi:S-adenosylmethionine uptake transporter
MQSLWMLVASFLFSIMGVCVKLASADYSTSEIVAYRGAIGMLMIAALIRFKGGTLKTRMPYHHLVRGGVGWSRYGYGSMHWASCRWQWP